MCVHVSIHIFPSVPSYKRWMLTPNYWHAISTWISQGQLKLTKSKVKFLTFYSVPNCSLPESLYWCTAPTLHSTPHHSSPHSLTLSHQAFPLFRWTVLSSSEGGHAVLCVRRDPLLPSPKPGFIILISTQALLHRKFFLASGSIRSSGTSVSCNCVFIRQFLTPSVGYNSERQGACICF